MKDKRFCLSEKIEETSDEIKGNTTFLWTEDVQEFIKDRIDDLQDVRLSKEDCLRRLHQDAGAELC